MARDTLFVDTGYIIALMQQRGISEALTTDAHFTQAGFDAVLLR